MNQQPATKLLAIVQERQCIRLEKLLACFPELIWNQVFSLVDNLSRQALIVCSAVALNTNCERSLESPRVPALFLEMPLQRGTAKD